MIIQVDLEGRKIVEQLCDIALKEGGIQNLNQVNKILSSVVLLPPVKEDPLPKSDPVTEEKEIESKVEEPEEEAKEEPKEEIVEEE